MVLLQLRPSVLPAPSLWPRNSRMRKERCALRTEARDGETCCGCSPLMYGRQPAAVPVAAPDQQGNPARWRTSWTPFPTDQGTGAPTAGAERWDWWTSQYTAPQEATLPTTPAANALPRAWHYPSIAGFLNGMRHSVGTYGRLRQGRMAQNGGLKVLTCVRAVRGQRCWESTGAVSLAWVDMLPVSDVRIRRQKSEHCSDRSGSLVFAPRMVRPPQAAGPSLVQIVEVRLGCRRHTYPRKGVAGTAFRGRYCCLPLRGLLVSEQGTRPLF
jgi:hypothetical protein